MRVNVTYDIISDESAELGDFAESGFVCEDEELRYAINDLFQTRTNEVGGIEAIEASCSDESQADWITVYNSREYRTGNCEQRSLHFPRNMTPSSRARLCRLIRGM